MEFFTFLYSIGREYRTVNTSRSALSATLPPIDGFPVGQHPLVKRQLKGIFNLRPPKVSLFPTWSVKIILDMFNTWGPASCLALQLLTYKTVFLLALACAKRVASLALLSLEDGYIQISESKIVLQPLGLEKHSHVL